MTEENQLRKGDFVELTVEAYYLGEHTTKWGRERAVFKTKTGEVEDA